MFLLPVLCGWLYNHEVVKTSAMIGGTLQSVGQVVASGEMVNEHVKEMAMIFKIVRVILLVVVVFTLGHIKHKTNHEIIEEEVKPQPIDTLSLDDDIEIRLSSASLQADAKGSAFLRVTVKNTSYEKFESIAVMLECNGVKRVWTGDLEGTAEVKVSMNIPARFSALAIKRDVNVTISYKDSTLKKTFAVTVHRYNPVRSR